MEIIKSVSIILPVYNGEQYLKELNKAIRKQDYSGAIEVIVPVSISHDNSYSLAKTLFENVYEVKTFNHAKTRHQAALKANGEILVFITQDILPTNEMWLSELVKGLSTDIVATYSRQIPYNNATPIERIIRNFNYPAYDRLCNKTTIDKWGRKNIYYSDSASATIKKDYLDLDGYNFDVVTNEDVVYVSKVINSGKSVLYNSKSHVFHSHNFSFRDQWKRYKIIGMFEAQNQHLFLEYNTDGEGGKLLKYVLKTLLRERKYMSSLNFLCIECPIRLISYKLSYYKAMKK